MDERKPTPDADQERRDRLNQRLRQEFIAGAEEDSRRRLGRGLTRDELERVLRRYPGDAPERESVTAPPDASRLASTPNGSGVPERPVVE